MDDNVGLIRKYNVYKRNEDGSNGELIEDPTFTLRPFKDNTARMALITYAYECCNPILAKDLFELVTASGLEDDIHSVVHWSPLAGNRLW